MRFVSVIKGGGASAQKLADDKKKPSRLGAAPLREKKGARPSRPRKTLARE